MGPGRPFEYSAGMTTHTSPPTDAAAPSRVFAVVPAAGHSRRMGQPKLLLPFRGRSIVAHLIETLVASGLSEVVIVVRSGDTALAEEVQSLQVERPQLHMVQPAIDPADMRTSVQIGLDALVRRHQPAAGDAWLLVPGDHPLVSRRAVEAVIAEWKSAAGGCDAVIPEFEGRPGHPTLLSWGVVESIPRIPKDKGLNWLLRQPGFRKRRCEVDQPGVVFDLDTPEDYRRLTANGGG